MPRLIVVAGGSTYLFKGATYRRARRGHINCTCAAHTHSHMLAHTHITHTHTHTHTHALTHTHTHTHTHTYQQGYLESQALINKWHGNGRCLYAVTPRFAGFFFYVSPSSSYSTSYTFMYMFSHTKILIDMCPHTTVYVLILLYVSSYCCMCVTMYAVSSTPEELELAGQLAAQHAEQVRQYLYFCTSNAVQKYKY